MSPETSPPTLSLHERHVLGVLSEKQKTTPDIYPLSINALVTGCNQKSNRDPVFELSDVEVEDTLMSCQKRGLVCRITGGRVERWRHMLYEAWRLDKAEMAVLTELLLRDPQTVGELRQRVSRMEPMADLDALKAVLRKLEDRKMIVWLVAEDRRGATVTHGFHEPKELERMRARAADAASTAPEPRPASAAPAAGGSGLADQLADLRDTVAVCANKVSPNRVGSGLVANFDARLEIPRDEIALCKLLILV